MKKLLIFGIALVMAMLMLVSCGDKAVISDKNTEANTEYEEPDAELVKIEDISEYSIVRGDKSSGALRSMSTTLKKYIGTVLGVDLKISTDASDVDGKKIIIGESKYTDIDTSSLREKEFRIKYVNGNIVIIGGTDTGTVEGVKYFMDNCILGDTKEIFYPSGKGWKENAYKVDSFKVEGTDIREYKIFTVDGISEGKTLSEDIYKLLGIEIPIEEAKEMSSDEKYIVLDRSSFAYYDYSVKVENGNVYVNGSYRSFPKALDVLVSYFDGEIGRDVNLTAENNMEGKLDKIELPYNTRDELLQIYKYAGDQNVTLYGEHLAGETSVAYKEATFRNAVGDGPAIIDFDLLYHYTKVYNRSQYSQSVCEILEHVSKGGIVTTMCHWINPNPDTMADTFYRGSLGDKSLWNDLLTDGTELNKNWKAQLDYDAEFFLALKKLGVSVTFRPLIEANLDTGFWWDYKQDGRGDSFLDKSYELSGDQLRAVWNYVYDYYTDVKGLDNLLWTYAPNASGEPGSTGYYYPGDDRCDLVAMDWYTSNPNITNYGYNTLLEYGKPCGLSEWGRSGAWYHNKNFTCQNIVDLLNTIRNNGIKISFFEVYHGDFGAAERLGNGQVLNQTSYIKLLDDMPEFIKKALGK